jgi:hypothetical protein
MTTLAMKDVTSLCLEIIIAMKLATMPTVIMTMVTVLLLVLLNVPMIYLTMEYVMKIAT